MTILQKVKSKMFIFAHRKARGMLDGEYAAVTRGRSLDFDDLRNYVPGDEIRDIDWKATARQGSPLVKRYVAIRRQPVLLVADTGRNMAAVCESGEPKREILLMALGVIGYLALRHGDDVGLVFGDSEKSQLRPPRMGEGNLESLLQEVDQAATLESAASNVFGQLQYIAEYEKSRRLIFVVADEVDIDSRARALLRRLQAQHEVLWLVIKDADLVASEGAELLDVDHLDPVAVLMADNPELVNEYQSVVKERRRAAAQALEEQAITVGWVAGTQNLMLDLFELLERHRRAHR